MSEFWQGTQSFCWTSHCLQNNKIRSTDLAQSHGAFAVLHRASRIPCQTLWSSSPTIKFLLLWDHIRSVARAAEKSLFMHIYIHMSCSDCVSVQFAYASHIVTLCLPVRQLQILMITRLFASDPQVRWIWFPLIACTHVAACLPCRPIIGWTHFVHLITHIMFPFR